MESGFPFQLRLTELTGFVSMALHLLQSILTRPKLP
jgi:hypothetical protein